MARARVADDMHRCAQELGLTPASRTRIEHKLGFEPASDLDAEYRNLIGAM